MKKKSRFLKSIIETSKSETVVMPYARGNRKGAAKRAKAA